MSSSALVSTYSIQGVLVALLFFGLQLQTNSEVSRAQGQETTQIFSISCPTCGLSSVVVIYLPYSASCHLWLLTYSCVHEQTDAAAKAYRVYHVKTGEEKDEDYLVDHSIIMYLLNPDAEFVTFYGKNFDAPTLAKSIKGHLDDWQKSHPDAKGPLAKKA